MQHLVRDRFRVTIADAHRIGEGGMAHVYEAVDTWRGDRKVAIKVMSPGLRTPDGWDAAYRSRFRHEVRMTARVQQIDGLVRYLDSDEHPDIGPWFAMEYVRGGSLRDRVKATGALGADEAVRVLVEAAEAVERLHAHRILHRDIKPGNLLLVDGERARGVILADFGIALDGDADERLTPTGRPFGTRPYAAPEQLAGADIGPPADVYALAVVLYELATGSKPPDPAQDGTPYVHVLRLQEAAADVPGELLDVVAFGMQSSPGDRYPSPRALADAACAAIGAQLAPQPEPAQRTWTMPQPGGGSEPDEPGPWSAADVAEIGDSLRAAARRAAELIRGYGQAAAIVLALLAVAYVALTFWVLGLRATAWTIELIRDHGVLVAGGLAFVGVAIAVVRSGRRPDLTPLRSGVRRSAVAATHALRSWGGAARGRLARSSGRVRAHGVPRRALRAVPPVAAAVAGLAVLAPFAVRSVPALADTASGGWAVLRDLPPAAQVALGVLMLSLAASRSRRFAGVANRAAGRTWAGARRLPRIAAMAALLAPGMLLALPVAESAGASTVASVLAGAAVVGAVLVLRRRRPRLAVPLGGVALLATVGAGLVIAPEAVRHSAPPTPFGAPLAPFAQWPPQDEGSSRAERRKGGRTPPRDAGISGSAFARYVPRAKRRAPSRSVSDSVLAARGPQDAQAAGRPVQDAPPASATPPASGAPPAPGPIKEGEDPGPEYGAPKPVTKSPGPVVETQTTTDTRSEETACEDGVCTTTVCDNGACSTTTSGTPADGAAPGSSESSSESSTTTIVSGSSEVLICDESGCESP
jgi:serine/threonine-protein kinase